MASVARAGTIHGLVMSVSMTYSDDVEARQKMDARDKQIYAVNEGLAKQTI